MRSTGWASSVWRCCTSTPTGAGPARICSSRRRRIAAREVVVTEGYLADEKDFRSTLVRVREANPDGVILISYYADGAPIARQLRPLGLTQPVVAVGSVYSPKFLELGGDAVNGVHTTTRFFPAEPRPEVQDYVARYRAKYGEDPDVFSTYAYDSIILVNEMVSRYGAERKAIHDGLAKVDGVPA